MPSNFLSASLCSSLLPLSTGYIRESCIIIWTSTRFPQWAFRTISSSYYTGDIVYISSIIMALLLFSNLLMDCFMLLGDIYLYLSRNCLLVLGDLADFELHYHYESLFIILSAC